MSLANDYPELSQGEDELEVRQQLEDVWFEGTTMVISTPNKIYRI